MCIGHSVIIHHCIHKLPFPPWVNMPLTKAYRLRFDMIVGSLSRQLPHPLPRSCPPPQLQLYCLLGAAFDSQKVSTIKKTKSLSVLFFGTKSDARRKPSSFSESKSVANMKKRSQDMRRNV
jgi:hypothetical protein